MNKVPGYDEFSRDYDRFVDWESRLGAELPFLLCQIGRISESNRGKMRILDAACGTGHHAIALAERGFQVAGADISPGMIEVARQNAENRGLDIPFQIAGFSQLENMFGPNSFSVLLCLGNSLPHVLSEAALMKTLVDFRKVLHPDGAIVLQNRNFDAVLARQTRWMPPQTYRKGQKTWVFLRLYDFDPDGRITFTILRLFQQGDEAFQQQVSQTRLWPMSKAFLAGQLMGAGFRRIGFFGDLAGNPYHPLESPNLVIIARV